MAETSAWTTPCGRRPGQRSAEPRSTVATVTEAADGGAVRRLSTVLNRHRGARLLLALGPPLAWLLVVYLGSLVLLLLSSFWRLDVFTADIVQDWGFTNFET